MGGRRDYGCRGRPYRERNIARVGRKAKPRAPFKATRGFHFFEGGSGPVRSTRQRALALSQGIP